MEHIKIQIIRSARTTLSVEVTETGDVLVRAPMRATNRVINQLLLERANWIEKNVEVQRTAHAKLVQRQFVAGEIFFYLGEPYTLCFDEKIDRSILCDDMFRVRHDVQHKAKSLIEKWYKNRARFMFHERVAFYSERMQAPYSTLRLSSAKTRWGSCGAGNTLNFNWRLVMAPLPVLDAVVVHELAHIHHRNHGKRFWRLVAQHMPNHKAHDAWLKKHRHLLEW